MIRYSKQCNEYLLPLINLLPEDDCDQLRREMTSRRMDWQNPSGLQIFNLFKEIIEIERNILESCRGLEEPGPKPRNKGVFPSNQSGSETSDEQMAIKVWFNANFRFPCPLENHSHEMAECVDLLGMKPFTRWEKTKTHCICYTSLWPKYVCKTKLCSVYSKVSDDLLCQGCKETAVKKGWSPLSILICKKKTHADLNGLSRSKKGIGEVYGKD